MKDRLAILTAARAYASSPDTTPFPTDLFPSVTESGHCVLTRIQDGRAPHRFDRPMFFFLMAASAFGGGMLLNSREPGKRDGKGRFYVRLDFKDGFNIPVNRIVSNAQIGERVREGSDYHDHLPESLTVDRLEPTDRPSKYNTTREDAIGAALRQYDATSESEPAKASITRALYEALLRELLTMADADLEARRASA